MSFGCNNEDEQTMIKRLETIFVTDGKWKCQATRKNVNHGFPTGNKSKTFGKSVDIITLENKTPAKWYKLSAVYLGDHLFHSLAWSGASAVTTRRRQQRQLEHRLCWLFTIKNVDGLSFEVAVEISLIKQYCQNTDVWTLATNNWAANIYQKIS